MKEYIAFWPVFLGLLFGVTWLIRLESKVKFQGSQLKEIKKQYGKIYDCVNEKFERVITDVSELRGVIERRRRK